MTANYAFYTTSEKAWDAMLEAISGAERSIYIEMYIFVNNTETHHFFDLLKEKARAGVQVKLILDSYGSNEILRTEIKALRSVGIEMLFFSYFLRHTHKKIVIVDKETAFLGGVNISKLFRKWSDLQLKLSGPIARGVLHSFAKSYRACGGRDPILRAIGHRKLKFIEQARIWFLEHQQLTRKNPLAKLYRGRLFSARECIVIVTPYFVPRRWLIGALHQAVLRGVRVEVIVPYKTDHPLFNWFNYLYLTKFANLGIKFYLYPEMNHAKTLLIDEREGMVGSANIDPLSFDYNLEIGAIFTEQKMIAELLKIIGEWRGISKLFTDDFRLKRWYDRLALKLVGII